jgi:hypothetical protein
MIITYQGLEFFKLSQGDLTIGADVALVSLNHEDFNGAEDMSYGDRKPIVINGPGEYETKDIFIRGLPGQSEYGGEKRINTIYKISFEGMELCFLGAQSTADIPKETVEALDQIDILFVPIGGDGVLEAAPAYKLAVSLEPNIIIPMHYGDSLKSPALKTFLKEGGSEKISPEDKLTIKKKDVEGREGDIIVLKAQL